MVGWLVLRRASYACPACGHGHCPLDATLGLGRDSLSPGVRRLAGRLGAPLPFAEASRTLQDTARVQLSASTVRTVTEAIGRQREQDLAAEIATAWAAGLPAVPGRRRSGCMWPWMGCAFWARTASATRSRSGWWCRCAALPAASGGKPPATWRGWNRRPTSAHGWPWKPTTGGWKAPRGWPFSGMGPSGSGTWPPSTIRRPRQIVDWFHASERIWDLGRALFGEGTTPTTTWVEGQLARLAQGQAATLAREWPHLACRGEAAALRDAQVTYFTNQASRMAYDRYRDPGWDIGSGMVEAPAST